MRIGLVWLALTLAGCAGPETSPLEIFERFDSAWKNGETQRINGLVSTASRSYFSGLQPWIIRGDEVSMKTLSPFDRFMILRIRMELDSLTINDWRDWDALLRSDQTGLAVSGYLSDLLEEEFFKTSLGKVDSVGSVTAGRLLRMGVPIGTSLRFSNENGWKIELAHFFQDRFNAQMKPYLSDRYRNRDRVWELLSERHGDRVDRSLLASRVE